MTLVMTRWTGVTDGGVIPTGAGEFLSTIGGSGASSMVGEADYASPGETMGVKIDRSAAVTRFGNTQAFDTAGLGQERPEGE